MTDPIAIRCAATIEAMLKRDYVAAISHLRWLDAVEGKWRYLHSQKNAINRIEGAFHDLFGGHPWPARVDRSEDDWKRMMSLWRNEIGYYCSRLGVAALIDDMRLAKGKNLKPRSLIYFLRSHDEHRQEQSSRWEMLLYAKMEEEWQETKRQEAEEAKDLQRGELISAKLYHPAWVDEARETLQGIKTKAHPTPEELREVAKIEAIMSRMGISKE